MAKNAKMGGYLFMGGTAIAGIVAAFGATITYLPVVLLTVGIIAGYLAITKKEAYLFLLAIIALLVGDVAILSVIPALGGTLVLVMQGLLAFWFGMAIPVAFIAIWSSGK